MVRAGVRAEPRHAEAKQARHGIERGWRDQADAWASREKGVATLEVTADDETGKMSAASVLASHGTVPDDLVGQFKGS